MVLTKTAGILKELTAISQGMKEDFNQQVIDMLLKARMDHKKVYCAGAGRSLLMIRCFAMRLMHMGYPSYVVGETSTPAIQPGDVLIFGSGSGETGALTIMMKKAKAVGAKTILITYSPQSTLGLQADAVLEIPINRGQKGFQPNGSTFEQTMLILCDAIVLELLEQGEFLNGMEINAYIKQLHANLE